MPISIFAAGSIAKKDLLSNIGENYRIQVGKTCHASKGSDLGYATYFRIWGKNETKPKYDNRVVFVNVEGCNTDIYTVGSWRDLRLGKPIISVEGIFGIGRKK